MGWGTIRASLLAVLLVVPGWCGPSGGAEPDGRDEAAIREIVTGEIIPGILRKSPDLYLRSYLPMGTVYSFRKGAVSPARYRDVLEEYFLVVQPESVQHEVQSLRIEGNEARMTVKYDEKGKVKDGSPYGETFRRYYLLVKNQGAWKIRIDGYNEALKGIDKFHGNRNPLE